jgi:chorismate dehydratase
MPTDAPLLLGDIEFLNTWPVTYALRKGLVGEGFPLTLSLSKGTPADLNRRLLSGELDASAVSSVLYLRHSEELVPVPGLCIRSDAGVHSVLVVSRQPLSTLKGRTLGVSNQGATTPVLLKLVARQRQLKIKLEVTPLRYPEILKEYPAALLIGDEALQASQSAASPLRRGISSAAWRVPPRSADPLQWWDLGEAWTSWTRLPFVYSLWVMRREAAERRPEALETLREGLEASYRWGQAHERELIGTMRGIYPFESNFLKEYLHSLSYELDSKAWAGLARFAREAEAIGELPRGAARKLGPFAVSLSPPEAGPPRVENREREGAGVR